MGAASVSARRLAFAVAWWCAVVASCKAPAETPSTSAEQAGGVDSSAEAGAGAAPEPDPVGGEAGASGKRRGPDIGMGGSTQDPTMADGGSGSPDNGGHPSVLRDPHGGEGAAGAESEPACGKQLDGTLCGSNMTPPGPDGARYFCSSGEIIAQAACPGPCDSETNACVQSNGTGGGMGETGFSTLLRCRTCYGTLCRAELMACDADPMCTAHLGCYESCSLENVCYSTCDSAFAAEPLLSALNACVGLTGCADICPH